MKSAAQITISKIIHSETVFQGFDIDPRTAPIFEALGLGTAGDTPTQAYHHLPDMFLAGVIGHYLIYGNADTAIRDAWRIECAPLPTSPAMALAAALDRRLFPTGLPPVPTTEQTVWAIRDTQTMQVIIYLRAIKGDAPCDYFTIDPI